MLMLAAAAPFAYGQERVMVSQSRSLGHSTTFGNAEMLRQHAKVALRAQSAGQLSEAIHQPASQLWHQSGQKIVPNFGNDATRFSGFMLSSAAWIEGYPEYGIYSLPCAVPAVITAEAIMPEEIYANGGGTVTADGKYLFTYWEVNNNTITAIYNLKYDINDKSLSVIKAGNGDPSSIATDMTYDNFSGKIYGSFFGLNEQNTLSIYFAEMNPATMVSTPICTLKNPYRGVAASVEGTLYAIDSEGAFGTVNKATGEFKLIKNTGLATEYVSSAAIDPATGVFYYAYCTETSSSLVAIDCATGASQQVYAMPNGEQMSGLYFAPVSAVEGAPAAAVINGIDFKGTSLRGTITFTCPETLEDMTTAPALGETLRYEVYANNDLFVSGSGLEYGHAYTLTGNVKENGEYQFRVVLYNEAGASPVASASAYIGADKPAAVKNVALEYYNGVMHLTWDPQVSGAHGGIIGNVTFNVYNDTLGLVAEALTDGSFDYTLEKVPTVVTEYSYYVEAVADGFKSEMVRSNVVSVGNTPLPYTCNMSQSGAIKNWTIINANNDLDAQRRPQTWDHINGNGVVRLWGNRTDPQPSDDWLITPTFSVEAGKVYVMRFGMATGSVDYPQSFELCYAREPEISPMKANSPIVPETTVTDTKFVPYNINFVAPYTGDICFGIHGTSPAGTSYLDFTAFSISDGMSLTAPGKATDLNVLVPYDGDLTSTLSWKAPTLDVMGKPLAKITRLDVLVDDEIVYTSSDIEPGQKSSIAHKVSGNGVHKFDVTCYNEGGQGLTATLNAYVGVAVPRPVTNLNMVETTPGTVKITWDAVTLDINGYAINPDFVRYEVIDPRTGKVVVTDLTANETELELVKPGEPQQFAVFYVASYSSAGGGYVIPTQMIPVGEPDTCPFIEGCADGMLSHPMGADPTGDGQWTLATDEYFDNLKSRNGDNGYFMMRGYYMQQYMWRDYGEIYTAKVTIDAENPVLSYYFAGLGLTNHGENGGYNTVAVSVYDMEEDRTITVDQHLCEGTIGNWYRRSIDLSEFKGKTVQIIFEGMIMGALDQSSLQQLMYASSPVPYVPYVIIDDIRIADPVANDLAADGMTAASVVNTDNAFDLKFKVRNFGAKKAKGYSVDLYADGKLLTTVKDMPAIEPNMAYTGTYTHEAYSPFETGEYTFSYTVNFDDDEDLDNNASGSITVNVQNTELPAVTAAGEQADTTAVINWNMPAIDITDELNKFEDFESASYPAFSISNFGPWTLRNYNGSPTWGINGIEFPNMGKAFGWILFDPEEIGLTESKAQGLWGNSGSRFLAAISHTQGHNEAWLISPDLGGAAQQEVSFMAKAVTENYGEELLAVYYSTTGNDMADFQLLTHYYQGQTLPVAWDISDEWAPCTFTLPAGTRYFAVRSLSNTFVLMIDDITYSYHSPFTDLELVGYNVYRDGELLNDAPLTSNKLTFTDAPAQDGKYRYNVTVVYNSGISAPSNDVTIDFKTAGAADAVAAASKIAVEGSAIVVTGAEYASIASVDGKLIYSAQGNARVEVAAGVYVVKTNDRVAKVIVR